MSDTGQTIGETIRALSERLRESVEWQWDGRFGTALAEFPIERKDEVLSILGEFLVCRWDSATVTDAPDVVRDLVKRLGGLMSGQLLLLSAPEASAPLFCAWWPWGNGQTVSIRIAPLNRSLADKDANELVACFRNELGV